MSHVRTDARVVAFIGGDDVWRPHHLEHAIGALEPGFDADFSDFAAAGYLGVGNMARIGNAVAADALPPPALA